MLTVWRVEKYFRTIFILKSSNYSLSTERCKMFSKRVCKNTYPAEISVLSSSLNLPTLWKKKLQVDSVHPVSLPTGGVGLSTLFPTG